MNHFKFMTVEFNMFVRQNKFCGTGDDLNMTDDKLARLLEHTIVFFGFNTLI